MYHKNAALSTAFLDKAAFIVYNYYMKRKIIMIIGAVLIMLSLTAPDGQLTINSGQWTITPVMTIPAMIYIETGEEPAEPATPASLPEIPHEPEEVIEYDNEWAFYLLDKNNPLPPSFEVALQKLGGEDEWWREIDERAADYALQMLEESRLAGVHIVIIEGFRTIERQQEIYNRRINYYLDLGLNEMQAALVAETEVARPGASEHNAGIALDVASGNYNPYSFEHTAEFDWLLENSWKYGFILRYPEDALHITGFIYEPWHWRFVGVKRAQEIYESGLTLEEFIMQLYAQ
jgi:D-alanyl-D-alanine carboxypeptidase